MINLAVPDWIKTIIELRPRLLFVLSALGGALLMLPEKATQALGLERTLSDHRGWVGAATLLLFALWVAQMIPSIRRWRKGRGARRSALAALDSLSPEERLLLIYCLARNQQTLTLKVGHRAASALVSKGLLAMAGGIGDTLAWPHTIPNFVWRHIRSYPQTVLRGVKLEDPGLRQALNNLDEHIRRYDGLLFGEHH